MLLFFLLAPFFSPAQLPTHILWDVAVGCQEATIEYGFDVEDPGECVKACEGSTVTYSLPDGDPQQWVDVQWLVMGGTLQSSINTSATIQWGSQGWGVILLVIETEEGIFEQEICIEIIASPVVDFTIYPYAPGMDVIEVCLYEMLNFENLSDIGGGSPLISYLWDFDDGTTSAEFEPSHAYQDPGIYEVTLFVTNSCNCSSYRQITVQVSEDPALQIVCNSIACENGMETYTVQYPSGDHVECGNYHWEVSGGQILSQIDASVDVQWNNVDNDGFGYLTFLPEDCQDLSCATPVSIKVPVIIDDVEIDGPDKICQGEQFRYAIPRWPSTEVQWKIRPAGANLILSDQSNEIIVEATTPGIYLLEAIYTNTLKGCGGSSLKEIEVVPLVDIQGPEETCEGASEVFTNSQGVSVNWVLEGPSGTYTASGTSFNHTFLTPGLYVLSLGQGNYCLGQAQHIQVKPKPVAPIGIDGPLEACLGDPVTYSVAPPPGSAIAGWKIVNGIFAGTGTQGATGEEVTVVWDPTPPNPSIPYQLFVNYVENGCDSDDVGITVVPLTFNFNILGPQSACSSSYETYSVDIPDGDKYEWSISPSSLGSIAENPQDHQVDVLWNNVTAPTQAIIEVKIKKCGSTHTQTYPVTIQGPPQISIAAPSTVCRDEPVNFGITGLTSWYSISWDFGDGATATNDASPTHTYTDLNINNVSYTVSLTVIDANGCSNTVTDSFTIQVQPAPVAFLTPAAANFLYCDLAGLNAAQPTFTLTLDSNYAAAVSIDWYHNGNPISQPPLTYSYTATDFGDYYAVVTSANGCSDTTNTITVHQENCSGTGNGGCMITEAVTGVTAQLTSCDTGTASSTYTTNNSSPMDFIWYDDGNIMVGQNTNSASFSISGVGIHIISCTAVYNGVDTNGDPCTYGVANSYELIVPYEPILYYDIVCASPGGYDITLYDASDYFPTTPITSFVFRVDGVSYGSGGTNGQVTVPGLAPGPHTLELEIDGSNGFPCTTTVPLTLPALPTVQINAPAQACEGEPVQFAATVNDPNVVYEWDFKDGALNSLPNPIRVFDGTPTNYNVTLTVTNQYGCEVSVQKTIGIHPVDMAGDLSFTPVCYGLPAILEYNSANPLNSPDIYYWNHFIDGVFQSTAQTTSYQISVNEPGLYVLDGEDTATGCIAQNIARRTVYFLETPEALITGPNEVCAGAFFQLNAAPLYENTYQYVWKRNGQVLSAWNNEPVIDQQLATPGIYSYEVEVTSQSGCSDIATFSVEAFPLPAPPSASFQVIGCNPYIVQLTAQANEPGTFVWSNGQSGPVANVYYGGPYRVDFFNQHGCSSSYEFDVPFGPAAYIWVHPEGCYEICEDPQILSDYYLSGPAIPFSHWEWQVNQSPVSSGSGQVADQYWAGDGFYQLTLDNGYCSATSEGMSWELATEYCFGWCEISVQVNDINPLMDMYGNCYYTVDVLFVNLDPPFSYTLDNLTNTGVIVPSGGVLPNGNTPVQLEFYPPDGFAGGLVDFRVLLELLQGQHPGCVIDFQVNFPPCPPGSFRPLSNNPGITPEMLENSFVATPNPTRGMLNIGYDLQVFGEGKYSLHLYDLSGREVYNERLDASMGEKNFDLHGHADGLYLLILRKDGKTLGYKKIVLSK